jgi:hypothetical protein
MNTDQIINRFDELINSGSVVLGTRQRYGRSSREYVNSGLFYGFRTASLSFLKLIFGIDHPYYQGFDEHAKYTEPRDVERGIEILKSAKNEAEGGWLTSVKGILSAEIFSDFTDMAEHLLSEGYKDPAAVIIGSVLEEHLRQLCIKLSIPTERAKNGDIVPKKADLLNSELVSKGAYNKLDQKNVTAWLDLRNKAAHGEYDEYTDEQVKLMLHSVRDFITRNPL